MRKTLFIATIVLIAVSCGRKGQQQAQATAEPASTPAAALRAQFPMPEIPILVEDGEARLDYTAAHYWDAFLADEASFTTDSLHVGGLVNDAFEKAMGTFATVLNMLPVEKAAGYVSALFPKVRQSGIFTPFTKCLSRYLYDPNSPTRNEDLWLPYVSALAECEELSPEERHSYAFEAEMCSLNRTGTIAADFSFTDTKGHQRTLHGIKAEYTLLIFGNPGCHACQEIVMNMESDERLSSMVSSGRLVVVDIYIDNEIDEWKAHTSDYPSSWLNGFDHNYIIRRDRIYNVRAIPSLYLLDRDKRILLKDAPEDRLFDKLTTL